MWKLAFLLFCSASAIQYATFGSSAKRADPCNLLLNGRTDCDTNQLPASAVTIQIPAGIHENLATWAVNDAVYPYTDVWVAARPITLGLHSSEADLAAAPTVTLSTAEGRCANPDTATGMTVTTTLATARTFTFAIPPAWRTIDKEFETAPRLLCIKRATDPLYVYTGLQFKTVFGCSQDTECVASHDIPFRYNLLMNASDFAARTAATTCCTSTASLVGQCVNPNFQACCGGAAYTPSATKCCREATELVQWNAAACPCWRGSATSDCTLTGETCCLPSKYSGYQYTTQPGECFNSTSHKCCETGQRYDPGVEQCCVINGLQSVDVPCPCSTDDHCKASGLSTSDAANFVCCRQTSPVPYEAGYEVTNSNDGTSLATCSIYASFPLGTAPAASVPCLGVCMNSAYQVCCNGVACVTKFERCCNATCCNKFLAACVRSHLPGSVGQWVNDNDFGTSFDICSTIEQMETVKAFWVFVWPALLMLLTFLSLAIVLGYASHANRHAITEYLWIERFMILLGVLSSLFCIPLFFAPLYKYGTLVVLASVFAIISAASRVRWLNLLAAFVQGVVLIYLFDPFHGNAYFTLAMDRFPNGATDNWSMGVLHSTWRMWPSLAEVNRREFCTDYFNFFKFDPQARDTERFENPLVPTFGYCSRGYVEALYLFEGGILVCVLLQLIVDLIAVVWRFKDFTFDPLHVEIHGKQL